MSNYDEAIKIVDKIYNKTDFTKEELQPLIDYLNKSETTEKEHEALKRDVARFIVLLDKAIRQKQTTEEKHERWILEEKLSKVGKEE